MRRFVRRLNIYINNNDYIDDDENDRDEYHVKTIEF